MASVWTPGVCFQVWHRGGLGAELCSLTLAMRLAPSMVLCMLQTQAPAEALSPQPHGKLPSAFCRVYSVA